MHPQKGSNVRLVGLKNPDLNEKVGTIAGYSRNGERVMVTLKDGRQGLIKVKPRQIEVIGESNGGRGRPGLNRRHASSTNMRSRAGSAPPRRRDNSAPPGGRHDPNGARDHRSFGGKSGNLSRVGVTDYGFGGNDGNASRVGSVSAFSNRSDLSNHEEVMATLKSADAMFDAADTNFDGVVSQEEFLIYMRKHTDHTDDMIMECFDMIDRDGNGDITQDEVRAAFLKKRREMKGEPSSITSEEDELLAVSKEADALFERADFDNNGILSKREFMLFVMRNTKHSEAVVQKLFESTDADKNGYITREEIQRAYQKESGVGANGEKKNLADILGLEDHEVSDIDDDVYSMFFLSDFCSQGFWFAIVVWVMKLSLVMIIAVDLYTKGVFPDSADVPRLVKFTQFLLLPVNVSVQEELITTFFIYANLKWSKHIMVLNRGASRGKYHVANLMRFLDGLSFLFINTTLLLQATQVLGAFLNFAALGFLSSIDNVALQLARDGYLTDNLENTAKDVLIMKLPRNHNENLQVLDSLLLVVLFLVQLVAWILFQFVF